MHDHFKNVIKTYVDTRSDSAPLSEDKSNLLYFFLYTQFWSVHYY